MHLPLSHSPVLPGEVALAALCADPQYGWIVGAQLHFEVLCL